MSSFLKTLASGLAVILVLGYAGAASAVSLTFTDVDSPGGTGNDITYVLDYSSLGGNDYSATFTITNSADVVPEWYVGWIAINFGDNNPTITNLSFTGTGGPWAILQPTTAVVQGGSPSSPNYVTPLQGNNGNYPNAGFYATSLTAPLPNPATEGVLVTGTNTATFTFNFSVTGVATEMPFQVGYYEAGSGGNAQFQGRLSEPLGVPEPGTLLLLGTGLLGLVLVRRRRC